MSRPSREIDAAPAVGYALHDAVATMLFGCAGLDL